VIGYSDRQRPAGFNTSAPSRTMPMLYIAALRSEGRLVMAGSQVILKVPDCCIKQLSLQQLLRCGSDVLQVFIAEESSALVSKGDEQTSWKDVYSDDSTMIVMHRNLLSERFTAGLSCTRKSRKVRGGCSRAQEDVVNAWASH
jgi:hypothetical protein